MSDISWGVTGALTAHLERDGHRFGCILQPLFGRWNVVGLVTPVAPDAASDEAAIEAVLAAHAHQALGSFESLDFARDGAIEFMRTAPVPPALCGCESVEARTDGCRPNPYSDATMAALRQAKYAALDGPALDHAVETLTCPIDDGRLVRKPNPRQAPGFGDIFVCSCGFEVSE